MRNQFFSIYNSSRWLPVLAVVLMLVLVRVGIPALSAAAAAVTVNDVTDLNDASPGDGACDTSGATPGDQCSLRAAIEELNAQGPDVAPHQISFNIPGSGPFIIAPASPLPDISVPVEIQGASQPGAACPSPSAPANLLVVLDGSNAGSGANGLVLQTGSDGSTLRGLVIGNFTSNGIRIYSSNNTVRCNYIGIGADGVTPMGNGGNGILLNGGGNTVGGQAAVAMRNVIASNIAIGIRIENSAGNIVRNNYIGTAADGMSASGNSSGMYIFGESNTIGGSAVRAGNLISGNNSYGIRINSSNLNSVIGNDIGLASDGASPLPNGGNGIELLGSSASNTLGGLLVGEPNRVAYNSGNGLSLTPNGVGDPLQNDLSGNRLFSNGALGIDLGSDGVDTNDPGDGDTGANQRQNYPVLQATNSSQAITITLDSQANTLYAITIYGSDACDPSGFGEGQRIIEQVSGTSNASGSLILAVDLSGLASAGSAITTTATDPNGNTSEFSNCEVSGPVPTPTPTVTATFVATATPTATSVPTATEVATATPTATSSPTPTAPSAGPTATQTPQPTAFNTPGATPVASYHLFIPLLGSPGSLP